MCVCVRVILCLWFVCIRILKYTHMFTSMLRHRNVHVLNMTKV